MEVQYWISKRAYERFKTYLKRVLLIILRCQPLNLRKIFERRYRYKDRANLDTLIEDVKEYGSLCISRRKKKLKQKLLRGADRSTLDIDKFIDQITDPSLAARPAPHVKDKEKLLEDWKVFYVLKNDEKTDSELGQLKLNRDYFAHSQRSTKLREMKLLDYSSLKNFHEKAKDILSRCRFILLNEAIDYPLYGEIKNAFKSPSENYLNEV